MTLSAPTHTLLFGPVAATDVPSAVVHRLRAAIGLGLLPDGQRLPKESELATQMGITTFALREALAELRKQGLLSTRAGKNGGSFVTPGSGDEEVERAELLSLSSADLRDLGDWRAMIAGHAAALAAIRASDSNIKTLSSYATRVAKADSGLEARRAHGRFHLELASAAQSKRLTRAEFAVHEQIDWLFGLALSDGAEREASARGLREVVEAVRLHNPERARARAETQVARLVNRLTQLRFEVIAVRQPTQPRKASTLAAELESLVAGLTRRLGAIARDAAPALSAGLSFQETRTRLSLAGLRRFEALPPFVKGVGVIADVGVIPEHPYWIQWWGRTDAGPVEDNHHVMDPSHEDFYDYQSMEFMTHPRVTRKSWASGPYVDYGGVDDYILTIASPIVSGDKFWGVACADLLVADLEFWLAPWLAGAEESCLLNSENRVIVSNAIRHGVGDVMIQREGYDVVELPEFGWSILTKATEEKPS